VEIRGLRRSETCWTTIEALTFGRVSSTNVRLDATLRDSLLRMTQPVVSVCVVTYRRPAGLARLLAGIARLRFNTSVAPKLEIVVVDNDEKRSAAPICAEMSAQLSCPISYQVEPRRGISVARNRTVRAARHSDFVAFIDDDEEPDQDWLDELLNVQRTYSADVVSGPVLPRFETPPPEWLRKGEFFERARRPTGSTPRFGAAGNVLVRTSVFGGVDAPFDERLALTGGEDTHFFLRLRHLGYRHVWADAALVYEWLPPSRARAGWLLQREYRKGMSLAFCERDLSRSRRTLTARCAKALAGMGWGVLSLPVATLGGRIPLLRALRRISYAAGSLAGLAGMPYEEYRVTHGS
jgi:succinoglycan biosynthesis protein ExoM